MSGVVQADPFVAGARFRFVDGTWLCIENYEVDASGLLVEVCAESDADIVYLRFLEGLDRRWVRDLDHRDGAGPVYGFFAEVIPSAATQLEAHLENDGRGWYYRWREALADVLAAVPE